MMSDQHFSLNTGAQIPALGLGTWQGKPGETQKAVAHALSIGYTHIDCAFAYGNEDEVGKGLADAFSQGIKREDIFVTTKLWSTYHSRVEENLDKSLKSLGLEYVDLYLMHWPVAMNPNGNHPIFPRLQNGSVDIVNDWCYIQTWKLMEKLLDTGKVRAIGVANHSVKFLKDLLSEAKITPAVNQIENHPALPQQEIVDFCKEKGIHITAYSPLGSTGSPLTKVEPVLRLSEKHGVAPATILLSYHLARGSSVLAKSNNPDRITANKTLIKLDTSDIKMLNDYSDELARTGKLMRFVDRDYGIDLGFPKLKQGNDSSL